MLISVLKPFKVEMSVVSLKRIRPYDGQQPGLSRQDLLDWVDKPDFDYADRF